MMRLLLRFASLAGIILIFWTSAPHDLAAQPTWFKDQATGCAILLKPWRGSLELHWEGACENGKAEGAGKLSYTVAGIAYFEQPIDPKIGVIFKHGVKMATPEVDAAITHIAITRCEQKPPQQGNSRTFNPNRKVSIEVADGIELAHGAVVERLAAVGEQKAWRECPARDLDGAVEKGLITVEIRQSGKFAVSIATCEPYFGFQGGSACRYENRPFNERVKVAEQVLHAEVSHRAEIAAAAKQEKDRQHAAAQRERAALSKEIFDAFVHKSGIAVFPSTDDLKANPYAFEGRTLGIKATFDKMSDRHTALFDAGLLTPIVVNGIPTSMFTTKKEALLAVAISGRSSVQYPIVGAVDVLVFNFVDALICKEAQCNDALYWNAASR